MGRFRKTKPGRDLLDRGGGVLQQELCFRNRLLGYPGTHGPAGFRFDDVV